MKNIICLTGLLLVLFSCTKENTSILKSPHGTTTSTTQFTKYTIRQGQNYCDGNNFVPTSYSQLNFVAKFDSTAIYSTVNPDNQLDINKLYGFADNNSTHQQFSARFGWRWSDNALRLFGYVYNNGIRDSKELGIVKIGAENNCSIKVNPKSYVFSLNGIIDSLPRTSTTAKATGYKLYPYFGGDETAPHTIYIWIKEL
ncbi:MAG: hypothetical protein JWO92_1383 [Chitinophagaceae bacterium]|nr:hypothetical protein [Chitinophagaceae bacterium]